MHTLVRKTLEIYINEKRLITQADIPRDLISQMWTRQAVFVTLYIDGRVIASSGRIQCQKENTVYECIDATMLCLKDPRFVENMQNSDNIKNLYIRVDMFGSEDRRMIQNINEMNTRNEGIILLSQNLGVISVVLPHMIHLDPTPQKYFDLACQKVLLDPNKLTHSDYVLYALKTSESTDMI